MAFLGLAPCRNDRKSMQVRHGTTMLAHHVPAECPDRRQTLASASFLQSRLFNQWPKPEAAATENEDALHFSPTCAPACTRAHAHAHVQAHAHAPAPADATLHIIVWKENGHFNGRTVCLPPGIPGPIATFPGLSSACVMLLPIIHAFDL